MEFKGTVSRGFLHFFSPPGPHINRQKRFRESFRFRKEIREKSGKNVCDKVSAWSLTRTLRSNIIAKPFLSVHFGLRSNILSNKDGQKPRDTVP